MKVTFKKAVLGVIVFLSSLSSALAEGRTIVVMDGSGSMWGQIDGKAKLEIARQTVAEVLGGIPADRELGLVAYGHREKGNCSDIELVVPAAKGTSSRILEAVNSMRFLGKTPLTEAVRQAAISLRYTEEEATVVLVTDGLETCEADPCALGTELEANGLKFTAHVVGFGLTKEEGAKVACLAENTGGRYIQAGNASDLTDALNATVNAAAQAKPDPLPQAGLTAPDEAAIGTEIQVGWSVTESDDLDTIVVTPAGQDDHSTYVYASSGNPVTIQMPGEPGPHELRYVSKDQNIVARRPIMVIEAPLSLSAPEQALIGQTIPVHWRGPDAAQDTIRIRRTGEDGYFSYQYVRDNNPVTIQMPDEPGTYELVYMLNDSEAIVTRAIEVVPAGTAIAPIPASLTAPGTIQVGGEIEVRWTGPGAGNDTILLRRPDDDSYISYIRARDGNPSTLTAPSEPGAYELVYKFDDDQVLARRPITVVTATPENQALLRLVPTTFDVPPDFAGTSIQWSANPLPGQDIPPEAWAMNDPVSGPVTADFAPGTYAVRGDAADVVFAGSVTVTTDGENRFVILPDETLSPGKEDATLPEPFESKGMGEDTGYFCEGTVPCAHTDPETGLAFLLPAGWHTDFPLFYETAAGIRSDVPTVTFFGPQQGDQTETVVLNPRQWTAMNGPCVDVKMGVLCRFQTEDTNALTAFEILKASLTFTPPPQRKAEMSPGGDNQPGESSVHEMVGELAKTLAGADPGKRQALDIMGALLGGVSKGGGGPEPASGPQSATAETLSRFSATAIDLGGREPVDIRALLVPQTIVE